MEEHKARAHALLSASGSSRWLNCTPSPRLEEQFPSTTSGFAEEGTLAHELSELKLLLHTGGITKEEYDARMTGDGKLRMGISESPYYSEDMETETDKYVSYVMEQYNASNAQSGNKSTLIIEERVDLTEFIKDGFGTSDATIADPEMLEIIDLKYGKGVRVNAKENSQLKLYGLGSLLKNELIYDVKTVRLTIVQPRLDAISSWDIPAEELRKWGEEVVRPQALKAYKGEGEQVAGDWCRWCKAKANCKALHDSVMDEFKKDLCSEDQLLSDSEILKAYKKLDMISDWMSSLREYILNKALEGKKWEGYKIVRGSANRKIINQDALIEELKAAKFKKSDFLNEKLKGIGDLEKLMKTRKKSILEKYIIKPEGNLILVPKNDKRPEEGIQQAIDDFS